MRRIYYTLLALACLQGKCSAADVTTWQEIRSNIASNTTLEIANNIDMDLSGKIELPLGNGITIKGKGGNIVILDGKGIDLFFDSTNGSEVTFENIEFRNGKSVTLNKSGAIFNNSGTLSFKGETIFRNNVSNSVSGAIRNEAGNLNFYGNTLFESNGGEHLGSGAIRTFGGNLIFYGDSVFLKNHSTDHGGAIQTRGYVEFFGTALFKENSSAMGGALMNESDNIVFNKKVVFDSNIAATEGGGMANYAHVIFNDDVDFISNKGDYIGGGLRNGREFTTVAVIDAYGEANFINNSARIGGGIYNSSTDSMDIINFHNKANFIGNKTTTGLGAGIYNRFGIINFKDIVKFDSNIAKTDGGGLSNQNGLITFEKTAYFMNNQAEKGAGVFNDNSFVGVPVGNIVFKEGAIFETNAALNGAGAIYNSTSDIFFEGNTLFKSNSAVKNAGAIFNSRGSLTFSGYTQFEGNQADNGGAIVADLNSEITFNDNTVFDSNVAKTAGGALYDRSGGDTIFNKNTLFKNNEAKLGGALYINAPKEVTFNGATTFLGNSATNLGGAINTASRVVFNITDVSTPVIFQGNTDSSGTNAFHLNARTSQMNMNLSNGGYALIEDNISGIAGSSFNIAGSSSVTDHIYLGSDNNSFYGNVVSKNVSLDFYNISSNLANANIIATNTHFNLINGVVQCKTMNLDLSGGGNSISVDVDPMAKICNYMDLINGPQTMTQLTIRDVNVLNMPIQDVTIFDLFDHSKFGTDLLLSDQLAAKRVTTPTKVYRWGLTPKLTLFANGYNPEIRRYQAASESAFMNQLLSYDFALKRPDEIYSNLREKKLQGRAQNSYAYSERGGTYVDYYDEDGSAVWVRPYFNIETFHFSNSEGAVNNQSYGTMLGFDFPMYETENNWKLFTTIYASYIGSNQRYLNSLIVQNGGYGGALLSAYKNDWYLALTANGGGLGIRLNSNSGIQGTDDYGIVTAGTALKVAYNWRFRNFIFQPNCMATYTWLSSNNFVNYQGVNIEQTQLNGITVAPGARLTWRNENGFEPYVFAGFVLPIMADSRLGVNGDTMPSMTPNTWAQFGAGARKRLNERVTFFLESIVRTGGRSGWGIMANIDIAL